MERTELHRLLARQLGRAGIADPSVPPSDPRVWLDLLARIDRAYRDHDNDRYIVERSIEVSTREMAELHAKLTAEHATLAEARVDAEVARRSERTRARFLANMSHELRTPLNAIIGYTELLLEDEPSATAELDRILTSAQHLLALINDLLDLSKIDAGRMDLHVEDVDVQALLLETAAAIAPVAGRRGTVVEIDVAPSFPPQRTDRLRLGQCLNNLASNAAKFTERGRIVLRARASDEWTTLAVEDTGIGIPAAALPELFRPFVQADRSTVRLYGGTGLGLALTRALVERLGGTVDVVSEVGVGSTFTLRLPRSA